MEILTHVQVTIAMVITTITKQELRILTTGQGYSLIIEVIETITNSIEEIHSIMTDRETRVSPINRIGEEDSAEEDIKH